MDVPKYEELMLPLLKELKDGQAKKFQEIHDLVAGALQLSSEQLGKLLPSGKETVYHNRLAWAGTYLSKAGLIERPERGAMRITDRGSAILANNPTRINSKFLEKFEEFIKFKKGSGIINDDDQTPQEDFEKGFKRLASAVQGEILDKLHEVTPGYFEQIVIDVLVAMGYGGSHADAAQAVGKSGDGGVDGVINQDRLGLDTIYVQAKRWSNNVGRPEIQSFAGALSGNRATKGIFITTAGFTAEAVEYIKTSREKIILIDGSRLAALMYEYNIGVSPKGSYEVKGLDSDYFSEI